MRDSAEAKRCEDCGTEYYLSPQEGVCVDCTVDSMTAEYGGGYTTITLSNDTWRTVWNFIVYALEIVHMNRELHSNLPSWHEPDKKEVKTVGTFQRVLASMLSQPSAGQKGE
tara:strand:- start:88 stop:423 length:336 start_codon:yes stop_codon:yes gene_type:complete